MPVFQIILKCFIFIPSQNKDILQWLEILLWSRMIIFHLAFWMLTKAIRRIHVRLQISPGYSEITASVVGLLARTSCETFSMRLISSFVSVIVIQGIISKSKHFTQGIIVNGHFHNPLQRFFMKEATHSRQICNKAKVHRLHDWKYVIRRVQNLPPWKRSGDYLNQHLIFHNDQSWVLWKECKKHKPSSPVFWQ